MAVATAKDCWALKSNPKKLVRAFGKIDSKLSPTIVMNSTQHPCGKMEVRIKLHNRLKYDLRFFHTKKKKNLHKVLGKALPASNCLRVSHGWSMKALIYIDKYQNGDSLIQIHVQQIQMQHVRYQDKSSIPESYLNISLARFQCKMTWNPLKTIKSSLTILLL